MSSRENSKKSDGDEPSSVGVDKEDSKGGPCGQAKRPDKAHSNQIHPHENERKDKSSTSNMGASKFSKLLGLLTLNEASYALKPCRWEQSIKVTGNIVSKEWILECHKQKKLVEIETYLIHAGKPWRKQNISADVSEAKPPVEDLEQSASKKLEKHMDKASLLKPITSASSKMA